MTVGINEVILALLVGIFIGAWGWDKWIKFKARFKKKRKRVKAKSAGMRKRPALPSRPGRIIQVGSLKLQLRKEHSMAGYDREAFGPPISQTCNGEGISPRDRVLRRDSDKSRFKKVGTKIVDGLWVCPYTGVKMTHPSQIQIDHIVPLAEAWRSGAQDWPYDKAIAFGRDLENLVAVSTAANQNKGDRDISMWLPGYNTVEYIAQYLKIKAKYGLSIDDAELRVIEQAVT